MVRIFTGAALAAIFMTPILGHPGEKQDHINLQKEIVAREHWAHVGKRCLDACSSSESSRRLARRNVERRARVARELRERHGITSRSMKYSRATSLERRNATDLAKWEAIDHNRTGMVDYNAQTSEEDVFSAVTSPILAPSVTDGPYYVWGEMIRSNVVEDLYSDGVPVHLELQYYDIETCQPIPDVYVDIWHANATGVYSGVSVAGNYASGGYNSTYLRGVQGTDEDGVVTFDTVFPGHYDGRATHTHLLAHMNVTVLPNNTLLVDTGTVTHIGQLFWNEVLRSAAEAVEPYSTNTQAVTSNADDMLAKSQASSDYDPFPEFLYLGSDIQDGIFAWKQIGLNTSADWTDSEYYGVAAWLTADGGIVNEDQGSMGGNGGGGNGTMPSGTGAPPGSDFPSGTALPSGTAVSTNGA